jgi:1,4-alpha-glucan branching enzyme
MLKKSYSKTRKFCRVTFKLPANVEAAEVQLHGEFDGWKDEGTRMRSLKDGSFSATLSLEAGKEYRFRYRIDGQRWENDWEADAYVPNEFGSEDSLLKI